MSMMDLQAALGGGGAPAGPPPEGQPVPGEEQPQNEERTSLDALLEVEEALQEFIQLDPDDADRAKASQALKIVLDLKAANTQDAQQGGMKSLSRVLAAGGGGGGGGY